MTRPTVRVYDDFAHNMNTMGMAPDLNEISILLPATGPAYHSRRRLQEKVTEFIRSLGFEPDWGDDELPEEDRSL